MFAMNLVDIEDANTNYGILFCNNDEVSVKAIQNKILEIKENLEENEEDWVIDDIVSRLPVEWHIVLQCNQKRVIV